jgi:hypothetical protein
MPPWHAPRVRAMMADYGTAEVRLSEANKEKAGFQSEKELEVVANNGFGVE